MVQIWYKHFTSGVQMGVQALVQAEHKRKYKARTNDIQGLVQAKYKR